MPRSHVFFSPLPFAPQPPYLNARANPLTGTAIDQLNELAIFQGSVVYFQFPDAVGSIPDTDGFRESFLTLSEAQRQSAREVFAELAHLLNVRFVEWPSTSLAPPADGNLIRLANASMDAWGGALGFAPGTANATIWINGVGNPAMRDAPIPGFWLDMVIRHEIGHSMGLAHPHDLLHGGDLYDWGNAWSIMSYVAYGTTDPTAAYITDGSYPQSFMPLDIAALHHFYGRNPRSDGDDVYSVWTDGSGTSERPGNVWIASEDGDPGLYDVSTGGGPWLNFTAWDSGGLDTLDFSRMEGGGTGVVVRIDRDRLQTWLGAHDPLFAVAFQPGVYGPRTPGIQIVLDDQSWIERLVGTGGADRFDASGGGRAVNLDGGGGADVLTGGAADDILTGGVGEDVFRIGAGSGDDTITDFVSTNDRLEIWGFSGALSIHQDGSAVVLTLSDRDSVRLENLQLSQLDLSRITFNASPPAAPNPLPAYESPPVAPLPATPAVYDVTGAGGRDADWIQGGEGANFLFGKGGDDFIQGFGARDILNGDYGNDRLEGGNGDDILSGGLGDDVLIGGDGDDTLSGGGDEDLVIGGNGTDEATFQGLFSEYAITFDGNYVIVKGRDGSDRLQEVETLRFHDGIVDLTVLICQDISTDIELDLIPLDAPPEMKPVLPNLHNFATWAVEDLTALSLCTFDGPSDYCFR